MGTRIQLCGRLEATIDGVAVGERLRGTQGRMLFAYLVMHRGRPVRRDELVEAVGLSGEGALAPLLSRLRSAAGASRVVGRGELALVLPEDAWIDWEALRDLVRDDPQEAVAIADRGLLPGLERPWIDAARGELADLRVEALEVLARTGDPTVAERAARAAVEAAPFRESARLALMEALAARGNVAEALRAFEDARVLLRDELGTAPGPALLALHERLLRGDVGGGGHRAAPYAGPAQPATPASGSRHGATPHAGPVHEAARPAGAAPSLVGRAGERAALQQALQKALAGAGRVVVIDGPAGIGKSRLLAALRDDAAAAGARILAARASQLEREFPFGVVRQLLEAPLHADRERLLAGAAAPAAAVFSADTAPGGDASFAALHGLYWLTLNLAEAGPLVLAVDDLHWVDLPSLRFLAYLSRRLDDQPVLLVATLRSGEASADAALVDELVLDPAAMRVSPPPLDPGAVATLVAERLGSAPDDVFLAACHSTTGGNPLLLGQLLGALRADNVPPDAAHADTVRALGSRAVAATVRLRLGRLPADAAATATAIAVLGEDATVPAIARLAELDEARVAAAAADLTRAEILSAGTGGVGTSGGGTGAAGGGPGVAGGGTGTSRGGPGVAGGGPGVAGGGTGTSGGGPGVAGGGAGAASFVHPLVLDAVTALQAPGERDLAHARAAVIVRDAGAPRERIAAHLLRSAPRGEAWIVESLRAAAAAALGSGGAESATTYLRRALAEPPPAADAAAIEVELGLAEALTDAVAARDRLFAAHAATTDPALRAMIAHVLGRLLLFTGDPPAGRRIAQETAAGLPVALEDDRRLLEAFALMSVYFEGGDPMNMAAARDHRSAALAPGPGARALASIATLEWAHTGGPADACATLARAALEDGSLLRADNGLISVSATAILDMADGPDAMRFWDEALAEGHARGSLLSVAATHLWRGWALNRRGDLEDSTESLTLAAEELERYGFGSEAQIYANAFLSEALLERQGPDAAAAMLTRSGRPEERSTAGRYWNLALLRLQLARGEHESAVETAERLGGYFWAENPSDMPRRGLLARALAGLGATDAALAAAEDELAAAQRWGAPATVGMALHVRGALRGDVADLEAAVDHLERADRRLELAQALAALGAARADVGLLQRAHALACVCSAHATARAIEARLRDAGGAPDPAAVTGAAALTAAERRAAELAAAGADERDIAQALFVTPRTASVRLASAQAKLGADTPSALAAALAA